MCADSTIVSLYMKRAGYKPFQMGKGEKNDESASV
jgi:hypothetical protein